MGIGNQAITTGAISELRCRLAARDALSARLDAPIVPCADCASSAVLVASTFAEMIPRTRYNSWPVGRSGLANHRSAAATQSAVSLVFVSSWVKSELLTSRS